MLIPAGMGAEINITLKGSSNNETYGDVTAKSSDGYTWQVDYGYVDIPSGQFKAKNIEWLGDEYYVVGHLTYDTSTSPEVIRSRAVVLTSSDASNWTVWSSNEFTEDGLNVVAVTGSRQSAWG